MQVHTKRRNKLLHDRMKDLVFVKFNSKLRQTKDKNRDPIEKPVLDVLEDEDHEWITGIEPKGGGEQEQEGEIGESSQGLAVATQGQEKKEES